MMKAVKKFLVAICGGALVSSCSTTMPLTATNNPIGSKTGKAVNSCLSYMPSTSMAIPGNLVSASGGLCFNDKNYGIAEAAKNGRITKVATVDLKTTNFVIFWKYELIITGE